MDKLHKQLNDGVFLTTEYEGKVNAMTIGWGMLGTSWGKPVFIALIRPTRYTYELLEKSKTFTLSIPKAGEMKHQISYFGRVSGRDEDKIRSSGVTLKDAKTITGKIIDGCEKFYECKVLFSQMMDTESFLEKDIINKHYQNGVFHNIIFAEILEEY